MQKLVDCLPKMLIVKKPSLRDVISDCILVDAVIIPFQINLY